MSSNTQLCTVQGNFCTLPLQTQKLSELIQKTPGAAFIEAFGEANPEPLFNKLTPKVQGGPINCMLQREVSVQISISCLALRPPTIILPSDKRKEPAVFVVTDSKSNAFSDTKTCKPFVGTRFAPEILDSSTARLLEPLLSSQ